MTRGVNNGEAAGSKNRRDLIRSLAAGHRWYRSGGRGGKTDRRLGKQNFVSEVLKEAEERQRRQIKLRSAGRAVQKLIEEECDRRSLKHC